MKQVIYVDGISCAKCKEAIKNVLMLLPGVEDIAIEGNTGTVSVTSKASISENILKIAVEEAGYSIRERM